MSGTIAQRAGNREASFEIEELEKVAGLAFETRSGGVNSSPPLAKRGGTPFLGLELIVSNSMACFQCITASGFSDPAVLEEMDLESHHTEDVAVFTGLGGVGPDSGYTGKTVSRESRRRGRRACLGGWRRDINHPAKEYVTVAEDTTALREKWMGESKQKAWAAEVEEAALDTSKDICRGSR
ncbi:MAG: hypothetical protein Q9208_008109 [Pyrenodesmia sp. 3 TL-2023]